MRILFALIVIGPLMPYGALPAAAGQSIPSDTPIRLAAGVGPTADTYSRKARDAMQDW
jgi:hypothetical protein